MHYHMNDVKRDDSVTGRSARSDAKYGFRGCKVGRSEQPWTTKIISSGPFASVRNVVPRIEHRMMAALDSDEEPPFGSSRFGPSAEFKPRFRSRSRW